MSLEKVRTERKQVRMPCIRRASSSAGSSTTPSRRRSMMQWFTRLCMNRCIVLICTALVAGTLWSFSILFQLPAVSVLDQSLDDFSDSSLSLGCESPSLPHGSLHIVVASYKYDQEEGGISFQDNNYLFDLRLTNAQIFWYRRVQPEIPARIGDGPCGMTIHERLLLPNYGKDGAAFVDHVLEVYDRPPRSIIFLHGHVAGAYHTSCESIFGRTTYVYRDLANNSFQRDSKREGSIIGHGQNESVQHHMMTLTSDIHGTSNFDPFKWFGVNKPNAQREPWEVRTSDRTEKDLQTPCWSFKQRWNHILRPMTTSSFKSCCASFVLPGSRIQRFPREFYQDLKSVLMDESQPDQNRACFEYVVYQWFGDDHHFTADQQRRFYDEADGLINGKSGEYDQHVLNRMAQCKAVSRETIENHMEHLKKVAIKRQKMMQERKASILQQHESKVKAKHTHDKMERQQ